MSLLDETTILLREMARTLPGRRSGKPLNFATAWRWATRGVLSPNGTRIRLETAKLGGQIITSHEALERFLVALNPPPTDPTSNFRTPAARQRADERASQELKNRFRM